MKICVVGAGAIGGYMAVRLSTAGHDVSVVARGPHLAAIKSQGLALLEDETRTVAEHLTATDRIADLGSQDMVILALKAHQIAAVVDDLPGLLVSRVFTEAGFKSRILDDIRSEIWLKLWGNLTFNPIRALTHSTLVDICQFPLTRDLAATMMTEAQTVGERLGAGFSGHARATDRLGVAGANHSALLVEPSYLARWSAWGREVEQAMGG